jgi:cell division protein FtsB
MFTLDITISFLSFFLIILGSGFLGFAMRSRQIKKKQSKVAFLRREMVYSHAYILQLEKENVNLELQLRNLKSPTPVLPLKIAGKDYPEENKRLAEAAV